ncbi:uncharacterized protein BP5553_07491 [Venustampulla echinocandica]|uniref:Uncharacterized protein n=1 Tax=Venustampulla echinocandica TaxID=2656787 RepID=A0A370TGP4_9HELO|nr:uncharacterized protein BP5553_07491 [Venustampulla echinocandica]RDL34363.1 hypothetical protein BP5553_07491 [Venustampulla echinocandica]
MPGASPADLSFIDMSTDVYKLLKGILELPMELRNMIATYSSDSMLWRPVNVLSWGADIFEKLQTLPVHTICAGELNQLSIRNWVNSNVSQPLGPRGTSNAPRFLRIGIDISGVQFIEPLDDRPVSRDSRFPDCFRYIVEEIDKLKPLKLMTNGLFYCIEAPTDQSIIPTLWNIPNPPDLSTFRVAPTRNTKPRRMSLISIDSDLTGISIFCTPRQIYGIHAHTALYPSAMPAWGRLSRASKVELLWVYFPLNAGESIYEAWIRRRAGHPSTTFPMLMLKTNFGRFCMYGPNRGPDYLEYRVSCLADKGISQIVHEDPEPGDPIQYFGVFPTLDTEPQRQQLPRLHSGPTVDRGWCNDFLCTEARLENVIEARCFVIGMENHGDYNQDTCMGVLLTYSTGMQEALGRCCVGLYESITVKDPVAFHWRKSRTVRGIDGVCVGFSSDEVKFNTLTEVGWQTTKMSGKAVWWFDFNRVYLMIR